MIHKHLNYLTVALAIIALLVAVVALFESGDAGVQEMALTGSGYTNFTTLDLSDALHVDGIANLDDVDIDLSSEFEIDGALVDIGGGTCGVADGDNDLCVAAVLEVDGEIEADGPVDLDGSSDVVQLSVTGYTTQTNDLVQIDGGLIDIGGGTYATADGDNDLGVQGDLEVNGNVDADGTLDVDGTSNLDEVDIDGAVDLDASVTGADDLEHVFFPTVASTAFTYTAGAGGTVQLFTVSDGEIWLIHDIYVNVTTSFDCTGDDCTVHIGDGSDEDGLCDLDDGELQTSDTEVTGAPSGWQCFASTDTIGAYITSGRGFIYAPSGADETIDAKLAASGDDFSAGGATVYIVYTRIQ